MMDMSEEQQEIVLFGMGGANEKYMMVALDWMDDNYSSAAEYLKAELMVDEAAGNILKQKLLC